MKLKEILVNCNLLELVGEKDLDILSITFDSRKVSQGTLFFAVVDPVSKAICTRSPRGFKNAFSVS